MDKMTLIKTQGLIKRYPVGTGEFIALKGIDLDIAQGEFTGLVGPSGSGKTTFLNIVGALDAPSDGTVEVLGKDLSQLSSSQAAKHRSAFMGFIFQTYNLLPVYTVFENVEFPLLLLGKNATERRELVMQALEWLGIADKAKSRPKMLSGGESQRVAIARAMVKQPKLVLADEPTANLDAENSHHILETMSKLNQDLDTTFVFATHDEKVISYLHRKVTLVDGRIQFDEIVA